MKIQQQGFTYIEVIISSIVISMLLIPVMDTFLNSARSSSNYSAMSTLQYSLRNRMEEVLLLPIADLDQEAANVGSHLVETSYSDQAGTDFRRMVFLARYDGDNADLDNDPFTGGDLNLIWIKVKIENTDLELETLASP